MVGYPKESIEVIEKGKSGSKTQMAATAYPICLPVARLEDAAETTDAFRGRIEPYADGLGGQPADIAGMSGGPLLSIQREPDGNLRYYLHGIQSSWSKAKREIRAVSIRHLVAKSKS